MDFIDLKAQQNRIRTKIDAAIARVLDHGQYIMGPEVKELEQNLCTFTGAKHCISCSNGTDALALPLMAWGIKEGDAVFVPAFTFVATAEIVAWLGATPIFVDVQKNTFNIDPESLKKAVVDAKAEGLTPKAVIPVDLFGQPADYRSLLPVADENGLYVLCDAAQSLGASLDGRRTGTFGHVTATSFFPAKPLGCYGDGGAIFTDDDTLAGTMKSIRVHGQGSDKYDNVRIGKNARLDTIQAAILIEKLKIFEDELKARDIVAARYNAALGDCVQVPRLVNGAVSAWAQYTIVTSSRAKVQAACRDAGIPTVVYYPIPLNRQTGYKQYPSVSGGVPVSDALSQTVLSLPMHPYLTRQDQEKIINVIHKVQIKEAA